MANGDGPKLRAIAAKSLTDLDGFYTFLVGTKDGFGVLRDPIACKPAVMAETQEYVAFGSEYRAFAKLPEIKVRASGSQSQPLSILGIVTMKIYDLSEGKLRI